MIRQQKIDPYNDSEGPSTKHEQALHNYGPDPKKIKLRSMTSETHHTGLKSYGRDGDPLRSALGEAHKSILPRDNEQYHHTGQSKPRGAIYHPAGAFGRTRPMGVGSTHQLYGPNRFSARPSNAVPGMQNTRRGDNAVPGHQNTYRGQNAVPGHENRMGGDNAIGHAPNRYGENALAARFRPRFGKPHGNRV